MVLIKEKLGFAEEKWNHDEKKLAKLRFNNIQPSKSMIERMKVRIEPTNMGI